MEDIRFNCPQCNQTLEAPAEMAGQTVACPSCEQEMIVPEPPREALSLDDIEIEGITGPEPSVKNATLDDITFSDQKKPPVSAADIIASAAAAQPEADPVEPPAELSEQCPECGATMQPESVLCTACGYHQTLGKKISTELE